MNRYEGIFTFDTENHRYIPIEQAGVFNRMSYKPAKPLIKDEKIRKAVRAWAEANEETELKATGGCLVTTFKGLNFQLEAKFRCRWTRDGVYTIAELCGEGEE